MVFFFIAYLSIIFLICFPFKIKIVLFYSNSQKKFVFYTSIGFFKFSSNKKRKQNINKKRKTCFPLKIRLKRIRIKKPIDYQIELYATRPKKMSIVEKKIIGASMVTIGKTLNTIIKDGVVSITDNDDGRLFIQFCASIKTNLLLIFSSILQTITFRRK